MTTYENDDEAWDAIEFRSRMICAYIISIRRWGCGTIEGCSEGNRCDVLDHKAQLEGELAHCRKLVGR